MLRYHNVQYVYMDSSVLTSAAMTIDQMDYFSMHHIGVKLYLPTVWEERITHEHMDYVCETIYGASMMSAVLQDIRKHKIDRRKVLIIGDVDSGADSQEDISLISVGKGKAYASYASYYDIRSRSEPEDKAPYLSLHGGMCWLLCALSAGAWHIALSMES